VQATLVVLLTITVLLTIGLSVMRWRVPGQPRLGPLWGRTVRRRSPGAERAVELGIITAACLVLPVVAIGLTVGLIAALSHVH
jgi:hypothetical protein